MASAIFDRTGPSDAGCAVALLVAGCERQTNFEVAPPRPVRTVIAEKSQLGPSVLFTGQISPIPMTCAIIAACCSARLNTEQDRW